MTVPLPLRLAGVFALLTAATLLVVAVVSLSVARSHLDRNLDAQLRGTAQSFRIGPEARARDAARLNVEAHRWLAQHPLPAGQMAAIAIAGGRVLTSVGGADLFEVPAPRTVLDATSVRWLTLQGSEGAVRGLTVPIRSSGRRLGTLVLLAYEKPIATTLTALMHGTVIASAIGLALALSLGLLVVRRSLRPLTRMAGAVDRIEATGDLSRRVSAGGPADEVGRLAHAFDRMLGRLEEAFREQRRFLADASHELRTPLTIVRGQIELLANELDTDKRDALLPVTGELDRMARIVEDLLLLARLDEGTELRREPVEVELVLREGQLRAMQLAPREVHVEAQPDVYALADPDRLLQVVTNLVTNAVQHTDETGRITLTSERRNGHVRLRVSDNGHGIPAADLPHVFERFYRGHDGRSAAPEGAGLGLAIAASIVKAMHGQIEAKPASARGATFTVDLPATDC